MIGDGYFIPLFSVPLAHRSCCHLPRDDKVTLLGMTTLLDDTDGPKGAAGVDQCHFRNWQAGYDVIMSAAYRTRSLVTQALRRLERMKQGRQAG